VDPEYVVVLITLPSEADAQVFARALVEARLAACVNLLPPMDSVYRWEGRVEVAAERQAVIKTRKGCLPALWERVVQLHPYDVPEFLVLPVIEGSEAYLRWIGESTRG
jgi:periplasmic divalent cation tolerance protein